MSAARIDRDGIEAFETPENFCQWRGCAEEIGKTLAVCSDHYRWLGREPELKGVVGFRARLTAILRLLGNQERCREIDQRNARRRAA